jgi:hypothetical protein
VQQQLIAQWRFTTKCCNLYTLLAMPAAATSLHTLSAAAAAAAMCSPMRTCHCKKSQCLKLYCDCFANGAFCSGCACLDCRNVEANTQVGAIKSFIVWDSVCILAPA